MSRFSDGHWRLLPGDPRTNVAWRRDVLAWAKARGRPAERALRRRCERDVLFYFDLFAWTYNPLVEPHVFPFVLWENQRAAVLETAEVLFGENRSMIWEKTRYEGGTWCAVALFDWLCLFRRHKSVILISHNEKAVENGPADPSSLFWKLRFMHRHLPAWLAGEVKESRLKFQYPTGSAAVGWSTSKRSGVGGRGYVLLDEFGRMEQDYEIFGQTADTGPRLVVSTHYGVGTAFYTYTRPDSGIRKVVWHWSENPTKNRGSYRYDPNDPEAGPDGVVRLDADYAHQPDYAFDRTGRPFGGPRPGLRSPWYDREVVGRTDRDISMHLDIDAAGASAQFFRARVIEDQKKTVARPPLWSGELEHDGRGRPKRLVATPNGALKLWVLPDTYGRIPPSFYGAGADVSFGQGSTPSVIALGDAAAERPSLVALYADAAVETGEFAALYVALCRLFADRAGRGALGTWESTGPAGSKFTRVVADELGYENSWAFEDDEIKRRSGKSAPKRYGWAAVPRQKNLLLEDLRESMEGGRLLVPCAATLEECLHYQFSKRGDKVFHGKSENADDPRAGTVNHGDRVIAVALMWKMMGYLGAKGDREKRTAAAPPAPNTVGWYMGRWDEKDRLAAGEGAFGRSAYLGGRR